MKKEGNGNLAVVPFWATLQEKKMKKAMAALLSSPSTLEEEEKEGNGSKALLPSPFG
jgi:hypothetical protein